MIYLCTDPNLYSLNKQQDKIQQVSDTRCIMIDRLINTAADIIDSIWSNISTTNSKIMPTAAFIKEILKRSRATFSMLQLALFYLFRIRASIQNYNNKNYKGFVCCGRRMFLAALMVASKYLNDKNYRNKTWAKIACLPVYEINKTEYIFLDLIQYQLYVSKPLYDKWVYLLHHHIQKQDTSILSSEHPQYTTTATTATTAVKLPWIYQYHDNMNSPISSCNSSPDMISTPSNTPPLSFSRKRSFSDEHPPSKHVKII